jgi:DNA-binding response OmpR family regulator
MGNGKKKVLIVEEDLFLANIYRVRLEQEGFEVRIAHGGKRGLEVVAEFAPDLVLAEVMLTERDGFILLEEMRKQGHERMRLVFLTKLGEKEDVERGLKLGADAYFIKTQVTFREVLKKISALLE